MDLVTLDCIEELYKLHAIHPRARCVVRLLVDDSASSSPLGVKFGAAMDDVPHSASALLLFSRHCRGFWAEFDARVWLCVAVCVCGCGCVWLWLWLCVWLCLWLCAWLLGCVSPSSLPCRV